MFAYPRLASLPPLAMGFWEQMHNLDEIVDEHELVPEILFVRLLVDKFKQRSLRVAA